MSELPWKPLATEYDPLKIGSIDGTDDVPHDYGIVRAMNAQSEYKTNKSVRGNPNCTIFVTRLSLNTIETVLEDFFGQYGPIERLRLVRDIVTGFSKRYAFVEFEEEKHAQKAVYEASGAIIDHSEILVDRECERTLSGWVPRRFGGGFGGRKESGQLRFGCKERPFVKPFKPGLKRHNNNNGFEKERRGRDSRESSHIYSSSSHTSSRDRSLYRSDIKRESRSEKYVTSHRKRSRSRERKHSSRR